MMRPRHLRRAWQSQELVDSWMVIFSDLITLLVTLFVLFLSMSSLKAGQLDVGTTQQWSADGHLTRPPDGMIPGLADNGLPAPGIGDAGAWIEQFKYRLGRDGLNTGFSVHVDERGLILASHADWLATDGRLTAVGVARLEGMAAYLARSGRQVAVTQIGAGVGASWQQIADRALAVGQVLIDAGVRAEQVRYVARKVSVDGTLSEQLRPRQLEFVFSSPVPDGRVRPGIEPVIPGS